MGVGVLLLLGVISGSETSRAWTPDASALLYEKYWKINGGMEAVSNRVDMMSNSLLALGAQYGWQLAGMMLLGAALMRSGWLKGSTAYSITDAPVYCWSFSGWRLTCLLSSLSGIWTGHIAGVPSCYKPRESWARRCKPLVTPR